MRTPGWWAARSFPARVLWPLSLFWRLGAWLRPHLAKPVTAEIPVLCVGNAVAGGAGKTPVVAALTVLLKEMGHAPHILSRGHGGRRSGDFPHGVAVEDTAAAVGDEPLLLARLAPVWVGGNRVASAAAAAQAGGTLAVMDDGWQSPHLAWDIGLMVVEGVYGFGNGWCLPAGPLREPVASALARADAVVLLGEDAHGLLPRLTEQAPRVFRARIEADAAAATALAGGSYWAFAGIGRPEKFFTTLAGLKLTVAGRSGFADHHPYRAEELAALTAQAAQAGSVLLTTEKDWVRLPPAWQAKVRYLPVACRWEDAGAMRAWLAARLENA